MCEQLYQSEYIYDYKWQAIAFESGHVQGQYLPDADLHPYYGDVGSYRDIRPVLLDQIAHFFEHYKDLEASKWVKVKGWGETEEAMDLIRVAIDRAKQA